MATATAATPPTSGAAFKARQRKQRANARHVAWLTSSLQQLAAHHTAGTPSSLQATMLAVQGKVDKLFLELGQAQEDIAKLFKAGTTNKEGMKHDEGIEEHPVPPVCELMPEVVSAPLAAGSVLADNDEKGDIIMEVNEPEGMTSHMASLASAAEPWLVDPKPREQHLKEDVLEKQTAAAAAAPTASKTPSAPPVMPTKVVAPVVHTEVGNKGKKSKKGKQVDTASVYDRIAAIELKLWTEQVSLKQEEKYLQEITELNNLLKTGG